MDLKIPNGKLHKMEFRFYTDPKMNEPKPLVYPVMYNPSELKVTYSNEFDSAPEILQGIKDQKITHREPRTLNINLFFDATGASPSGTFVGEITENIKSLSPKKRDLHKEIKEFLNHGLNIDGDIHGPKYTMVVWGKIHFPCVMSSATVTFKLFHHDGTPLRANVEVTLLEHIDKNILNADQRLLSPDLTKEYIVKKGDRLDNLCQKMYKDPTLYNEVARVNNLKNHRSLIPGQSLIFPPIDKRN